MARDTVKVGDAVMYVLPDGENREAHVEVVFNPGVYPRGGVVALKIQVRDAADCLGGEVPRGDGGLATRVVESRGPRGELIDRLVLVDDSRTWRKRGVAYQPRKSALPGTWHWKDGE